MSPPLSEPVAKVLSAEGRKGALGRTTAFRSDLSHRPPFCKRTPARKDEPLQALRPQDHSTKGGLAAVGWLTKPQLEQACSGAPCTPPETRNSHTSRGSSIESLKAGAPGSWQGVSAAPRAGGGAAQREEPRRNLKRIKGYS